MYCVKCGVELADSEKSCPLCKTPVFYPGREISERPYPEYTKTRERLSPRGALFIWTYVLAIAAIISLLCDFNLQGDLTWSGYVAFALILVYLIFVLPVWFSRPSPEIFIPADFLCIALYLLYINAKTGGNWFFSLALPLVASCALIISTLVILLYYIKRAHLYIIGGSVIGFSLFSILVEYLINKTFYAKASLIWSYYPAITLFLIGIMLFIIALVKPFRETLKKKFFV